MGDQVESGIFVERYRGLTKTVGQGKPKLTIGGTTPHSIVVQTVTTTLAEGFSKNPLVSRGVAPVFWIQGYIPCIKNIVP